MIRQNLRSLIEQGSALTITLPKEWTVAHSLKKGDFVKIEDGRLGKLVISVVKQ